MKKVVEYVTTIIFSAVIYCGVIVMVDLIDIYMFTTGIYLRDNVMIIVWLKNILYYLLLGWTLFYVERKCLKSIWSEKKIFMIGGMCISYLFGNLLYHFMHEYIITVIFLKNICNS